MPLLGFMFISQDCEQQLAQSVQPRLHDQYAVIVFLPHAGLVTLTSMHSPQECVQNKSRARKSTTCAVSESNPRFNKSSRPAIIYTNVKARTASMKIKNGRNPLTKPNANTSPAIVEIPLIKKHSYTLFRSPKSAESHHAVGTINLRAVPSW